MKHVRSLRFEALETRRLLSTAHAAVAHAAHPAAVPLVLDGTLTAADSRAASSTTMNADGSMTTSVAVAGQLGAVGEVHGVWEESVDAYGDYQGPDELILRDANGSFAVGFNDQNSQPVHAKARGTISYEHTQEVLGGTKAYAGASERGSIELTTNAARTQIVSLTLETRNK